MSGPTVTCQRLRRGRPAPNGGPFQTLLGTVKKGQEQTDQISPFAKRCCGRVKVYAAHVEVRLHSCVVTFMPGRLAIVRLELAALALSLIFASTLAVADERDAWAALVKGGHVALVRHGSAPPGYGDPPGFKIDDCATQRNLDERGREQSRALGDAFRLHGVPVARVISSPWCRCLETARLMALGPVESVMAVASSERSPERLVVLKQMVADCRGPDT